MSVWADRKPAASPFENWEHRMKSVTDAVGQDRSFLACLQGKIVDDFAMESGITPDEARSALGLLDDRPMSDDNS